MTSKSEEERAREIDDAVRAADAKRADAEAEEHNGEKLDKLLEVLDSISRRMDSFEGAEREAKRNGAKESMSDDDEEREKGEARKLGADARADGIRFDSEEIEAFKAETGSQHAMANSVLADIQSRADRASSAWGKDAPHPWDGETITAYRRRTAHEHKQHSPQWKDVDLRQLSGQTLRNAADQIFADSYAASRSPESYGDVLREVVRRDPLTGHTIKEYFGKPSSWLSMFAGERRFARFNREAISKSMSR
jgi:uncharacterized protein YukE